MPSTYFDYRLLTSICSYSILCFWTNSLLSLKVLRKNPRSEKCILPGNRPICLRVRCAAFRSRINSSISTYPTGLSVLRASVSHASTHNYVLRFHRLFQSCYFNLRTKLLDLNLLCHLDLMALLQSISCLLSISALSILLQSTSSLLSVSAFPI